MAPFVFFHDLDDGAGADVAGRQAVEVSRQMVFDLSFSFNDEAQADGVARPPGQQTDAESPEVPKRIQPTDAPAQFRQALLGPGQMVGLFA